MESLLLMAAAVVALGGALFHGYVGGKIYMGHVNTSDLVPLTRSLSLVSWHMFTVFFIGQWCHAHLCDDEARSGFIELPRFAGECIGGGVVSFARCDGSREASKIAGYVLDGDDRAAGLAGYLVMEMPR
jgi:hypothetical protein